MDHMSVDIAMVVVLLTAESTELVVLFLLLLTAESIELVVVVLLAVSVNPTVAMIVDKVPMLAVLWSITTPDMATSTVSATVSQAEIECLFKRNGILNQNCFDN